MVVEPTKMDHYEQSYDQMKLTIKIIANKNPRKLTSFFAPMSDWKIVDTSLTPPYKSFTSELPVRSMPMATKWTFFVTPPP